MSIDYPTQRFSDLAMQERAAGDVVAEKRYGRRDRRLVKRGDRRQPRVVAVTGAAGYIGSLLVRRLLDRGYRVRVVERFLYGDSALRDLWAHPNLSLIVADFRQPQGLERVFEGADAVVHLGAIVGDPACALDEAFTLSTNLDATDLIASLCRAVGVPRLVFASTCSVYGASDEVLDEGSDLNPVSLYARSKIAAERLLLENPDDRTAPVVLRFATAYGASYRPRFDLAVNVLTAKAITDGQATIFGGDQWRPFVHVDDIARALLAAVEAPLGRVAYQVFNVGTDEQNHQLYELGTMIKDLLPRAVVQTDDRVVDCRNYHVRFTKIARGLRFQATHSLRSGIAELALAVGGPLRHWQDPYHNNHAYLQQLIASQPTIIGPVEGSRLLRAVRTPREALSAVGAD